MSFKNQISEIIQEQILLGYQIPELAKMWGVSATLLTTSYKIVRKDYKYIQRTIFSGKTTPYYANEWDYGRIPTYNFDELSNEEIKFYNNFEKTNKLTNEH